MRGNPGVIVKQADGKILVVHNNQPLLKEKGKIVVHLLDENLKPILKDGQPEKYCRDVAYHNLQMEGAKLIGYFD